MLDNIWANRINQALAAIKLVTYSTIALVGIYRLFANWDTSRVNWQQPLDGDIDFNAYSISILLVKICALGRTSVFCAGLWRSGGK